MGHFSATQTFVITMLASIQSNLIVHPIWMIQARVVVDKLNKSVIQHASDIYKEGGWQAFYRGIVPGLVLTLNPTVNFTIYEKLKDFAIFMMILEPVHSGSTNLFTTVEHELPWMIVFLIAVVAKFVAALISYPLLTIKTIAYVDTSSEGM